MEVRDRVLQIRDIVAGSIGPLRSLHQSGQLISSPRTISLMTSLRESVQIDNAHR